MKFKIAMSLSIADTLEFLVHCRMHSLVLGLLAIQCVIDSAYSLQYVNADLNQMINYLQKLNRKEAVKMYVEDSHSDDIYSPHKHSINHKHVDENPVSDTELTQSGLEKLSDLLNKHGSKTRKPIQSESKNEENSKVYLVLDPQAKLNTADVKRISEVVSSLISGKGKLQTVKGKAKQMRRYKGFALMDDFFARRRNRDSNEKYPMDSIERDYKPKRPRNDFAGAGRTAIPYIGHRGDIYDKE